MTSDDERRDSLADQAAAWIPPWLRERDAEPSPEAVEDRPQVVADPEVVAESPAAVAGPGADDPPLAVVEPGGADGSSAPDPEPAESEPVESAPVESGPVESGPVESAPVESGPVESGPVESGPAAPAPVGSAPVEAVPAASAPGGSVPRGVAVPSRGDRPAAALALIDDDELRGALEAILLVVDEPVAELVLAQVLEQPAERVGLTLERIARDYTTAGHGFELRRAAGGWRLYTRPEYASYVERFILDGQSVRLTQAALETLAVVAYKQPVTRSRISAIRGVNCDGVIRTLVSRGLVEECGTEPDSGAHLYRTTTLFLEKLGLDTVDELPPLAPFLPDDLEEMTDAPR